MKLFLYLIGVTLTLEAISFDGISARRNLQTPYTVYEKKVLDSETQKLMSRSALSSAKLNDLSSLPNPVSWKNNDILLERFEALRDARLLSSHSRRATWLYPDDGCYARAAIAIKASFESYYPVPHKVFAFGNLRVKTSNSPRGVVGWWYHVAPIVEVHDIKYVLDPAIEPTRPLELTEWLSRMGKPAKMKVSICLSGTYSPGDNCEKETDGLEKRAERAQTHFLTLEWNRLARLGRDAELELGEHPPWINQ